MTGREILWPSFRDEVLPFSFSDDQSEKETFSDDQVETASVSSMQQKESENTAPGDRRFFVPRSAISSLSMCQHQM